MLAKFPWFVPALLHALEAVIVVCLAIAIAHFFPQHQVEAGMIAIGALSFAAKGVRASSLPVPDFVNGDK